MEFQGTICGTSGLPLGSADAVEAALQCLFTGVLFEWTRSGAEKLAEMDTKGIVVPDLVRKVIHSQPFNRCGQWSDGMVDVTLNLGNSGEVDCIWLTIGGDDCCADRILAMLREHPGWTVVSPEPLKTVEVSSTDPVTNSGTTTLYFSSQSQRETHNRTH